MADAHVDHATFVLFSEATAARLAALESQIAFLVADKELTKDKEAAQAKPEVVGVTSIDVSVEVEAAEEYTIGETVWEAPLILCGKQHGWLGSLYTWMLVLVNIVEMVCHGTIF